MRNAEWKTGNRPGATTRAVRDSAPRAPRPAPRAGRLGLAAVLLLPGCLFPVNREIGGSLHEVAAVPLDRSMALPPGEPLPPPTPLAEPPAGPEGPPKADPTLRIPPGLPGSGAPDFNLPRQRDPRNPGEWERAVRREFPPLPEPGPPPEPAPGPDGRPLDLPRLIQIAMRNSPPVAQAAADVEAARGAAIQAGLYPNPTFGYQADQVGDAGTAGQQGGFLSQQIITAGKLKLAQAAAFIDVLNARLTLRRVQIEVTTRVRAGYFAVLVARENVRITTALVRFTDEVYRRQVDLLRTGQATAAAAAQSRVLAVQARAAAVVARNRFVSAWKQLAAVLGTPDMPATQLAGRADVAAPAYAFDALKAQVFAAHTDVLSAENTIRRERYRLRHAQVMPVPDLHANTYVERDLQLNSMQFGVQMGFAIPIFDRNQGGIIQAQANVARAVLETGRVRNDLAQRLAEAYERYQNNRVLIGYYRDHILPDQVRAYRGVYRRYQQQPEQVSYGEIIVVQQTLANSLTTYLAVLGAQWQAVADVAGIAQLDDLYAGQAPPDQSCVPLWEQLLETGGSWPRTEPKLDPLPHLEGKSAPPVLPAPPAPKKAEAKKEEPKKAEAPRAAEGPALEDPPPLPVGRPSAPPKSDGVSDSRRTGRPESRPAAAGPGEVRPDRN